MAIVRAITFISSVLLSAAAFNAWGLAVSIEKQAVEGPLQNAFVEKDGEWLFVKNTNYFDEGSASLGKFKASNPKDLRKAAKELAKTHNALEKAYAQLPDAGAPDKRSPHQIHYKVGKHRIYPGHPYFERVKNIYEAMRFNAKLQIVDGMVVTLKDKWAKDNFSKGKKTKSAPFNPDFECKKTEGPLVCEFKGLGLLFLGQP